MTNPLFLILLCSSLLPLNAEEPIQFNRDVRPILSENCYACHGFDPKHREANLRLDTFDGATEDRKGVRGIIPGDAAKSAIFQRILSTDPDEVMPPPTSHKPPLTEKQRSILKRWIDEGAKYEPHWAFVAPTMPKLPERAGNPIDGFIAAKLATEGLKPSPPADAVTLIRRVSLDLTGLPPSVAEVDAFTAAYAADAEKAYSALVDRLLASPHYGERWGRWWLDQARYADSNGYSVDAPREIWKYRDWVVDALNKDMPFDQFTIEQLAGDLLPKATLEQQIATGFHRNTPTNEEGGIDKEQFRIDSVFDRVGTTGNVWLGLTVGCAQCHDHKFDPIQQKEFFQLFAFLNNQEEPQLKVFDPALDVEALKAEFNQAKVALDGYFTKEAGSLEAEIGKKKRKLAPAVKKALEMPAEKRKFEHKLALFNAYLGEKEDYRPLAEHYNAVDKKLNQGTTTLVLKELPKPRKTHVFIKGDFTRPAEEVTPGTLSVLHPLKPANAALPTRLDLAKWIVSADNPLTPRVIANRIWQQYFGRGIVESENDFGLQSTVPSHPELLDWLALQLLEKKWSLKAYHRLIVHSDTYRQSSADTPLLHEKDPKNYWLGRQTRLRLDAEIIRDTSLAASGLLAPKLGGPPVFPPIPEGVMGQGQIKRTWTESRGADKYRRGLYTFLYRGSPPPALSVFDAPDGSSSCTRRIRSNTPLQALTVLNDGAFFDFAKALAKIIEKDGLETAFKRCTARNAKPEELAVLRKLDTLGAARVLLNLDETLTRE